jgi:hypothetical protein
MGIVCPYASTRTVSSRLTLAFPVRIDASSRFDASSDFSIAVRQSFVI